jgi:hypothetical protein
VFVAWWPKLFGNAVRIFRLRCVRYIAKYVNDHGYPYMPYYESNWFKGYLTSRSQWWQRSTSHGRVCYGFNLEFIDCNLDISRKSTEAAACLHTYNGFIIFLTNSNLCVLFHNKRRTWWELTVFCSPLRLLPQRSLTATHEQEGRKCLFVELH